MAPRRLHTGLQDLDDPRAAAPAGGARSHLSEETGPALRAVDDRTLDNNLVMNFTGQPAIGERIIMHGRVLDENGRGVPGVLVEMWQANAGGRYRHKKDGYLAPLDPNFGGCGRTLTGPDGRMSS